MRLGPVGASLLAKVVNDNAGLQDKHVVLGSIASELAPTEDRELMKAFCSAWPWSWHPCC
ncbi:hypothetical protein C1X65_20735 [Pseudomonas sp. FW305-70]|nr:hypothetical protein C1X65_20735 [Pseudomonas sp. FW305-70]